MARLGRAQPFRPFLVTTTEWIIYHIPQAFTVNAGVASGTGAAPSSRYVFRADGTGTAYNASVISAPTPPSANAVGVGMTPTANIAVAQDVGLGIGTAFNVALGSSADPITWAAGDHMTWVSGEDMTWVI